jgi:hypothetical protein
LQQFPVIMRAEKTPDTSARGQTPQSMGSDTTKRQESRKCFYVSFRFWDFEFGIVGYTRRIVYRQSAAVIGEKSLVHPSSAQGIEAEIPEELRSNSEELERKARFLARSTKNAPGSGLEKSR